MVARFGKVAEELGVVVWIVVRDKTDRYQEREHGQLRVWGSMPILAIQRVIMVIFRRACFGIARFEAGEDSMERFCRLFGHVPIACQLNCKEIDVEASLGSLPPEIAGIR